MQQHNETASHGSHRSFPVRLNGFAGRDERDHITLTHNRNHIAYSGRHMRQPGSEFRDGGRPHMDGRRIG